MKALVLVSLAAFLAVAACGADEGGVAGGLPAGGGKGNDAATDGAGGNTGGSLATCIMGTMQCNGLVPQMCQLGGIWGSSDPCPYLCKDGACIGTCKPTSTQCKFDKAQTCNASGEWDPAVDCEFGCENGSCRSTCLAGEFNCYGNEIRQCDAGPPPKWIPKSPATVCAAASGQKCDAKTGTCVALQPIGSTTPNGKYYQFAIFQTSASAFQGGYDVTSWGDYVYVNRSSANLDVYKITLLDSDGDGLLEPNQHPDNPDNTGPVEARKIELTTTYTKAADGAPLGPASQASLHAQSNDKIFSLGPTHNGVISEYAFGTKATTVSVQPTTTLAMSFIGFGFGDGKWYAGNESARRVFSWHAPTKSWVAEFLYPNLAGSHMDGMEVVVSPKTGEQYVYVSDMTSDFIGQYRLDPVQGWVQEQLFQYSDSTSSPVEGFGFGTLKHFWATSGTFLYELGGGDIQKDLEPCENGKQACGDNLAQCPTGYFCQAGCCKKNVR